MPKRSNRIAKRSASLTSWVDLMDLMEMDTLPGKGGVDGRSWWDAIKALSNRRLFIRTCKGSISAIVMTLEFRNPNEYVWPKYMTITVYKWHYHPARFNFYMPHIHFQRLGVPPWFSHSMAYGCLQCHCQICLYKQFGCLQMQVPSLANGTTQRLEMQIEYIVGNKTSLRLAQKLLWLQWRL